MDKKTILIIDDEKNLCLLVKMRLQATGKFKVIMASKGKQGIKAARRAKPDLILLDIMIPDMDGFKVLEALKKDEKTLSIPVVMLTVVDDATSRHKAFQSYDEDYITKPVKLDELQKKIEDILKRV